jgi:hypothetical protein
VWVICLLLGNQQKLTSILKSKLAFAKPCMNPSNGEDSFGFNLIAYNTKDFMSLIFNRRKLLFSTISMDLYMILQLFHQKIKTKNDALNIVWSIACVQSSK